MNLDNITALQTLDAQNMLAQIDALPDQLAHAWALGQTLPLPYIPAVSRVLICGMGSEGNAAELLAAYAAGECPLPVFVQRDYGLPAWAAGTETLVIAVSHSGEDEETLAAYSEALKRGCSTLAICTGGVLASKASIAGFPLWRFKHKGQPRSAFGFYFGLLLAFFTRQGWLPEQAGLVNEAVAAMRKQQKELLISVPAALNPAKRYAGQFVGRWATIFGFGLLAPVARRWKCQINEMAKAPANFEALPEADHNTLAGILNPATELLMPHCMTLFLAGAGDHSRTRLRSLITRQTMMVEGLNTDVYLAPGENRLAQAWNAVHFGDYMAYYLAMAYNIDPTPLETLLALESTLAAQH